MSAAPRGAIVHFDLQRRKCAATVLAVVIGPDTATINTLPPRDQPSLWELARESAFSSGIGAPIGSAARKRARGHLGTRGRGHWPPCASVKPANRSPTTASRSPRPHLHVHDALGRRGHAESLPGGTRESQQRGRGGGIERARTLYRRPRVNELRGPRLPLPLGALTPPFCRSPRSPSPGWPEATCIPLVKIPGARLYPGTRTSQTNRSGLGRHLYHLPLSRGHREAVLCPDISFSLTKLIQK